MLCFAAITTFQLLFEFTKFRELSDVDGNIVPGFQSRVVKALLDIMAERYTELGMDKQFSLNERFSEDLRGVTLKNFPATSPLTQKFF